MGSSARDDRGDLRIGISGWNYRPWRGTFFPKGLVQKRELAFAASQVRSVEINGSFYSLQRPSSYQTWYNETPDDFLFSVKGGRFITHMKKLSNVEKPLANFFASGVLCLGKKLGPILWQLPPNFIYNRDKLGAFFDLLPRDTKAAAALAAKHDERITGDRAWLKTDALRPIRYALEVRHDTFENEEFIALLRNHDVALVVADTAGKWPFLEDVTSDFVYLRLHGDEELYVSGYTDASLKEWARKIESWSRGKLPSQTHLAGQPFKTRHTRRDVFVYFDNDVKVQAPFDAMMLAHLLGVGPKPPARPDPATIAERARTIWPASIDQRWNLKNGTKRSRNAPRIKPGPR